jgi:hypothetical protein
MKSNAILMFYYINFVNCYYKAGHQKLGQYTKEVFEKHDMYTSVYNIIGRFSVASSWADQSSIKKKFPWSKRLHYINLESCHLSLSDIDFQKDTLVTALLNYTNSLKYNVNSKDEQKIQMKFLMHFLQDFNQPMHVYGKFRGGNNLKIHFVNNNNTTKTVSLHTIWDSILPEYFIKNEDYTLPNIKQVSFSGMFQYKDYLVKNLVLNNKIACNAYTNINKTVYFKEYYDKRIIRELFDRYLDMVYNTFNFISTLV